MTILHQPTTLDYSWLPQYPTSGRQFRLRTGQWLATVPKLTHVPYRDMLNAGVTHCVENPGNGPQSGIPFGQRAMITDGDFLIAAMGNRPFQEWDQPGIRTAVFGWVQAGAGAAFLLSELQEKLLHTQNQGGQLWNESEQARWYDEALAQAIRQMGGRYFGGYDGHGTWIYLLYGREWEAIRQGLATDQAALALFRQHSGFGNQFYVGGANSFRDGCLKFYYNASDDAGQFIMGALMTCQGDENARRALGSSCRVAVMVWSGYYEITETTQIHHVDYERDVPAGGRMIRNTIPLWTGENQRAFFELLLLLFPWLDLYSWEAPNSFGADPNIVSSSLSDGIRYEGSGAQGASSAIGYDPDRLTCYPPQPEGGQDLVYVAAETVSTARIWAGLWGQQWTPHHSSRHGWTGVDQRTYLLDAWAQGHGLARLGLGSNQRWIYYVNFSLPPGQWETVTVDLQPGTFTFDAEGGTPYLFMNE